MKITLSIILITLSAYSYCQEIRTGLDYNYSLNRFSNIQVKYQKRLYNSGSLMNYSNVYQISGSSIYKKMNISSSIRYSKYDTGTNTELGLKEYNDKFRYTFDLNYKTNRCKGYKHKFRLRYQHSDLSNHEQNKHLRVKYIINYKLSGFCQFKTSSEVFYRLDKNRLNSVRLTMSTEFEINKLSIELFYTLERHWKMKDFEYYNITGLIIHYKSKKDTKRCSG